MRLWRRRRRRAVQIRTFDADGRARAVDPASAEGRRLLAAAQAALRARI